MDKTTTLKLNLDYKITYPDDKRPENMDKELAELTKGYIEYAVTASNASGLAGKERRLFSKIQRKVEEAIEKEIYSVDLSEDEYWFLKKSFMDEKCKFNALLSKYIVILEDEIFKV